MEIINLENQMGKEHINGIMVKYIADNLKKVINMEMAFFKVFKILVIQDNGNLENLMDMEYCELKATINIKEIFIKVLNKEMEFNIIIMVIFFQDYIKMDIKKQDNIFGKISQYIQEILIKMEINPDMEYGKKIKICNLIVTKANLKII